MNRYQLAAQEPRSHDYTSDARRDLGRRGIAVTGHAYVWNARRNAYDVTNTHADAPDHVTRYMVGERPYATHGHVRLRWPMCVTTAGRGARKTVCTTGTASTRDAYRKAQAFARAFDRTRSNNDLHDAPSALPCIVRDTHTRNVVLNADTRDAIAALGRSSFATAGERASDDARRARHLAAIDARIAERDRIAYMLYPVGVA